MLLFFQWTVAAAAQGSQRERREEEKTNQRMSSQTQEENSFLRFVHLFSFFMGLICVNHYPSKKCYTLLLLMLNMLSQLPVWQQFAFYLSIPPLIYKKVIQIISSFLPPEGTNSSLCDLQQRVPHEKQVVRPSEDQRPCHRSLLKRCSSLHDKEQKRQEEEQMTHLTSGLMNPKEFDSTGTHEKTLSENSTKEE